MALSFHGVSSLIGSSCHASRITVSSVTNASGPKPRRRLPNKQEAKAEKKGEPEVSGNADGNQPAMQDGEA